MIELILYVALFLVFSVIYFKIMNIILEHSINNIIKDDLAEMVRCGVIQATNDVLIEIHNQALKREQESKKTMLASSSVAKVVK
jgi:hypothetical protein